MTAREIGELALVTVAHGTVLAAAAWVVSRTVMRRARPGAIAALWTIVLFKFVVPFGPAMPYSLSDLIGAVLDRGPAMAEPVFVAGAAAPAASGAVATPPWLVALFALWLGGAAIVAVRAIRRSRRAAAAARALPLASADLAAELAGLARRLRAPVPSLRVAADGAPPHVVGVLRPIVVVPASLATPRRADERAAVLSHELAHLRRRDPWVAVIQAAAAAVLWWWPVVPYVNRRIIAAREAACDAWAVARGPLAREQYARLLLSFARTPAPIAGAALAARAGGLGARIDAVLDRGARPGVGPLGVVAVAVWTVIGLGGARSASARAAGAPVCAFTPELASSLLTAHPAADLDGDGTLSHAEACELQAELRRQRGDHAPAPARVGAARDRAPSSEDVAVSAMLAEPICCNCPGSEGMSSPFPTPVTREAACVVEGDHP